MPFIFYLATMNFTVIFGQDLIDELKNIEDGDHAAIKFTKQTMFFVVVGCTIALQIYWVLNIVQEIKEVLREGCDYLTDIWNYLDMLITITS